MSLPEEQLREQLIKLSLVSDTLASSWGKGIKAQFQRADDEEKLAKKIQRQKLADSLAEAKIMAKRILDAETDAKRQSEVDQKRYNAVKQFAGDLGSLSKNALSSANAIHTSDKAFSSITPTLELMGQVVKTVSSALSGLTAGIPIVEGISEAANKVVGVGVDITTQVASMMLQNAQTFVDTYTNLSKTGMNFSGNMDDMMDSAHDAGMSLSVYQKFVNESSDSLRIMGGTMDQAAARITTMSKSALKNNDRLLVEYGGYDQVASALANFTGTLTKSGVDTVAMQSKLSATSANYLANLKDIESITGRTAKQQKDVEDEALQNVAFQRKLRQVTETEGPAAAAALLAGLHKAFAVGGKSAENYYKELAATGRIMSTVNQEYRSFQPALAATVTGLDNNRKMYGKLEDGGKQLLKADGVLVKSQLGNIEANQKVNDGLYDLAYVGLDGVAARVMDFGSDIESVTEKRVNFDKTAMKIQADVNKKIGKSSEAAAVAYNAQIKTQKEMDEITRKGMPNMGSLVKTLNGLQVTLIKTFGPALTNSVDLFSKGLRKIAKSLGVDMPKTLLETLDANQAAQQQWVVDAEGGSQMVGNTRAGATQSRANAYTANAKAGAGSLTVSQGDLGKTLKLAPNHDVQGDGQSADAATIRAAGIIQDLFGTEFGGVTGMNDNFHQNRDRALDPSKKSEHTKGLAFDFVTNTRPSDQEGAKIVERIIQILADNKISTSEVLDEYNHPSKGAVGDGHFHVAVKGLAKGGITNGLSIAGEAGPEAVVPLPDGRTIPVQMDMSAMVDKLDQLLRVMKDQHDTSERILYAQS